METLELVKNKRVEMTEVFEKIVRIGLAEYIKESELLFQNLIHNSSENDDGNVDIVFFF
jgi:hypothetical protein